MPQWARWIGALVLVLAGCGEGVVSDEDGGDDAAVDGGSGGDAGRDASANDAGSGDAGAMDGGSGDAGAGDAGSMIRDAGVSDGGSDAGAMTTCPGFASPPADWGLGKGSPTGFPEIESSSCPGPTSPRHSLLDLDGDGHDDLVVTGSCGGGGGAGTSHWVLHRNTGTGFAATGATWPLPPGYPGGFPEPETVSCVAGAPRYRTFDVDGDRRPDLVVTSICGGGGMIGRTHWVVHTNTGTSFAAAGTSFALPSYGSGFLDTSSTTCTGVGPRYATLDADGDLDPDLVVTELCDGSMMVGRTRWLVHRNDGTRFEAAPTDFALPGGYRVASFTRLRNDTCPFADSPRYATADLDGDRLPDLAVTSSCAGGVIGRAHWAVHRGTTSGFAGAATTWALPSYSPGAFLTLEGPTTCSPGAQPRYSLLDADADSMGDLIVTGLCSGTGPLGRSEWAVHLNTGAGFGAATRWILPADYPGANLSDVETVGCASGTSPRFAVRDLNGDGVMDLVVTSFCSGAGPVGRTHWSLHAGCVR